MATQTNCHRKACQAPLVPGETYYNKSTRMLYCEKCALWLNKVNREGAQRLYGSQLCVPASQGTEIMPPDLLTVEESAGQPTRRQWREEIAVLCQRIEGLEVALNDERFRRQQLEHGMTMIRDSVHTVINDLLLKGE